MIVFQQIRNVWMNESMSELFSNKRYKYCIEIYNDV